MSRTLPVALLLLVAASNASATAVSHVGTFRFPVIVQGHTLNVPYDGNQSITAAHSSIVRCVIEVPGSNRNSQFDYDTLVMDATTAGVDDATSLLLSPQFLTEEDVTAFSLSSDVLFWDAEGWKQGDQSLSTSSHPRPANISTFAALDSMLARIASLCPNLKSIVVCGHSAGGQFTNRFAAGSRIPQVLARGVPISFVVANPSSYMYMNGERLVAGTTNTWAIPLGTSCTGYNDYKFGLKSRNPYMAAVPDTQLINQFARRRVSDLLGEADTDPNGSDLDLTCPAELQGSYRLQRGLNYRLFLIHYYGAGIETNHETAEVPGVAHDSRLMFTSACGLNLLFGYGSCGTVVSTVGVTPGPGEALQHVLLSCTPNPVRGEATISFAIPNGRGPATVSVYDVRGRLVRTLTADMSNGKGSLVWDGRSGAGEVQPAGIYYVHLQHTGGMVKTGVVLLR